MWVTMIMFLESAMGSWNFEQYNELSPEKRNFGIIFHLLVLFVNLLILLNLVIAIMSDTYGRLTDNRLGLYSQGIIEAIPSYKNDRRYGGLIVAVPPLNILTSFMLPFFCCI